MQNLRDIPADQAELFGIHANLNQELAVKFFDEVMPTLTDSKADQEFDHAWDCTDRETKTAILFLCYRTARQRFEGVQVDTPAGQLSAYQKSLLTRKSIKIAGKSGLTVGRMLKVMASRDYMGSVA